MSDNGSETNKPPSDVMKAGAVICEEDSFSLSWLHPHVSLSLSFHLVGGALLFHNDTKASQIKRAAEAPCHLQK